MQLISVKLKSGFVLILLTVPQHETFAEQSNISDLSYSWLIVSQSEQEVAMFAGILAPNVQGLI